MEENTQNTVNIPNINNNNSQKQIAGAIVLAGILIAGAVLLKGNTTAQREPVISSDNQVILIKTEARPVSPDEHIIGNSNAPIVIIEYSDTECPFCKVFHNTLKNVVEKNKGEVAWVYRHFPIPELHPKAFNESLATECAWEQGGNEVFWKYINEVFARTESNNKLDTAELPKIAKDIGLDLNSFNSCLENKKYTTKVQMDVDDGVGAGVKGTPLSLVVSQKNITAKKQKEIMDVVKNPGYVSFDSEKKNILSLNGALPLEMINQIIATLLK